MKTIEVGRDGFQKYLGYRRCMKERPILMCGEMVRATLEERKTKTRRIVHPRKMLAGYVRTLELQCMLDDVASFKNCMDESVMIHCPYGMKGDRLWVRETFSPCTHKPNCGGVYFRADGDHNSGANHGPWKPSIFMPRWASRITLEIVSVKVERVQEISEEDAVSEGVTPPKTPITEPDGSQHMAWGYEYRYGFEKLWNGINAKRGFGWDVNPWVWVVEFKRVTP